MFLLNFIYRIFAGKTPLNLAKDKPAIVKVLQTGQNYQLVNGVLDDSQTDRGI